MREAGGCPESESSGGAICSQIVREGKFKQDGLNAWLEAHRPPALYADEAPAAPPARTRARARPGRGRVRIGR